MHSTITTTTNDNNWLSGDLFSLFLSKWILHVSDAPAYSLEYACYSWWDQLPTTLYEVGDLQRLTKSKFLIENYRTVHPGALLGALTELPVMNVQPTQLYRQL